MGGNYLECLKSPINISFTRKSSTPSNRYVRPRTYAGHTGRPAGITGLCGYGYGPGWPGPFNSIAMSHNKCQMSRWNLLKTAGGSIFNSRISNQGSQIKDLESMISNQGPHINDLKSRISNQGSQTKDLKSRTQIKNLKSRISNQRSQVKDIKSMITNQGSKIYDLKSRT